MAGGASAFANANSNIITPEQFQANEEYIQRLKSINDGQNYLDSYNDRLAQDNAAKLVPLNNAGSADSQNNSDAYAKMLERVQAVPREVLPDGVHTQEQLNVMEQYRDAVDSDILDFVRDVRTGANVRPQTVAMISDKAASEIQSLTGKEVYGNRVVLDSNGVRHIDKRHGVNGIADHSMADDADLARIEYVLDNYDTVRFDGDYADGYVDKNGKKAPIVVFEKRINGSYYVVEAVSDAKSKKNYVISAYKTKAANQSLDARAPQDTSENAAENTAFVKDSIHNSGESVNEAAQNVQYNGKKIDGFDDLNKDLDRLIGMYKWNEDTAIEQTIEKKFGRKRTENTRDAVESVYEAAKSGSVEKLEYALDKLNISENGIKQIELQLQNNQNVTRNTVIDLLAKEGKINQKLAESLKEDTATQRKVLDMLDQMYDVGVDTYEGQAKLLK